MTDMTYTLKNVHRGTGSRSRYIYADLYDIDGLVTAATLDYILDAAQRSGRKIIIDDPGALLKAINSK